MPAPIDTPDWVRDAVFYQVFPDRFARSGRTPAPGPLEPWAALPTIHGFKGGDLRGVADRLPYLADLGITALYLNPVFQSASNHRYHTYDYRTVDPLLGGNAALTELLDAAHARGMRVVLDGVFNHTGRGFWAFHHILENGLGSPYLDWFHVDHDRLARGPSLEPYPTSGPGTGGGAELDAGPYGRMGFAGWWGRPELPKLNTANPEVREHLLATAEHWLRVGIDGWRLDVPEEIDDPAFWQEFRQRCRAIRSDAYLVGEIWHEAHDWLRGDRFDAVMNYPLAQAILGYAAGWRLDRGLLDFNEGYSELWPLDGPGFARALGELMDRYDPAVTAVQLNLIDSHDTPRFRTLAGGDIDALRLAVLVQATVPGAPCIYYGDEIAMEGLRDPDCRRSFPTDEAAGDQTQRELVRIALRHRREHPALRRGGLQIRGATGGLIGYLRTPVEGASAPALVAINAGDDGARLRLEGTGLDGGTLRSLELPGWPDPTVEAGPDGSIEVGLAGRTGAILVPRA